MGERMPEREDNNLRGEVEEVYAALAKYEEDVALPLIEKPSLKHPQSRHILSRYVFAPLVVFCGFSAVSLFSGWPLDYIKVAFLFLLLVWYIALPSVQIMELYAERGEILRFLKNTNQPVIEGLSATVDADLLLVQTLRNKSVPALQLAKNRISSQQSTIERRLGTLIGALDKVGIVPGLITLVIAASSKQNELVTLFVAVVMFALYLFAFAAHFALPRLGLYVKLIESEIEEAEKK